MISKHYSKDRQEREAVIKEIGIGQEVATFKIDRGHANGAELHTITTNAIIVIRNERTGKLITKLIARPNQIKRYFSDENEIVNELVVIAKSHQSKGYNRV